MKKKFGLIVFCLLLTLVFSGCSGSESVKTNKNVDSKKLVFGFTPGPYSDQVKKGIEPLLKEKGYSIKYVEFSDPGQPNFGLAEGSLDVNIFQHTAYFENFKKKII